MDRGYDVIQMPAGLVQSQLPETIEVGVPFAVGDERYVLCLGQHGHLAVCEELDGKTTVPRECHSYYVIKRVNV